MMIPDAYIDALEGWMRGLDQAIAETIPFRVPPVTCQSCPHTEPGCCYLKTLVYFYEGIPIARALKRAGRDSPELRDELRRNGEEMEGHTQKAWLEDVRRPCSFLKAGRCSVYPVRPHACRTYWVASPPANCQPDARDKIVGILDTRGLMEEHRQHAFARHRELGLRDRPARIYMGALPRVVYLALRVLDGESIRKVVDSQPWPRVDSSGTWEEGDNPFRERLHQIRARR